MHDEYMNPQMHEYMNPRIHEYKNTSVFGTRSTSRPAGSNLGLLHAQSLYKRQVPPRAQKYLQRTAGLSAITAAPGKHCARSSPTGVSSDLAHPQYPEGHAAGSPRTQPADRGRRPTPSSRPSLRGPSPSTIPRGSCSRESLDTG